MTGASLSSAPSTASISPVSPLLTLNLPLDCSFHHNCQINFLLSLSPLQFQLIEPWKKSITGVLSSMTMSLFLSLVDPPWYSKCHMGALPDSHLIQLQNLSHSPRATWYPCPAAPAYTLSPCLDDWLRRRRQMTWFDLLKKHFLASNVFALTFVFLRQTLILLCGFRICLDHNVN